MPDIYRRNIIIGHELSIGGNLSMASGSLGTNGFSGHIIMKTGTACLVISDTGDAYINGSLY